MTHKHIIGWGMAFFTLSLLSIIFLSVQLSALVFEPKPCAIVDCFTENYGKLVTEAELIGYNGSYAICHCPTEPEWVTYKVALYRKY